MARYSECEIEKIRTETREAQCHAPTLWWTGEPALLIDVCNGCGSDSMTATVRDILTWIYRNYTGAHCIHDCRYEESDGTDAKRRDADEEFLENCLILWQHHYGWSRWLNPAAWAGRQKILTAYNALRVFGKDAWMTAYKRNLEKGGNRS